MRAIEVTKKEGGEWRPFEVEHDHWGHKFKRGCGGYVHAIKFDNGCIWDTVNGWRGNTKPRVRVKMGRSVETAA